MAERVQEKVMPTYSAKDKVRVVNTVTSSVIHVKSFSRVTQLLKSGRIHPIQEVGHSVRTDDTTFSWSTPTYGTKIDDNDAEGYFNYLRLIASGGLDAPPDKVKAAFDQLFAFVYAMGSDIQIEGEHPIFTRKTLDERLQLFESKLTGLQSKVLNFENTVRRNNETIVQETQEMSRTTRSISELKDTISSLGGDVKSLEDTMNSSNEKIAQILERIDQWLKLHTPTLHRAKREYDKLDRRVKQADQQKKRGN